MTLIVKMDGTDGLVIESLHEPIKDILWGKYRTPEQVRNFILENWFLPDVEITVTGNLEYGLYTVHGKGPNWQREIVVKGHQVCRPKSLVCSNDRINKLTDNPDIKIADVQMTIRHHDSFVELTGITPTGYHVGKFEVRGSSIILDLIGGSSGNLGS